MRRLVMVAAMGMATGAWAWGPATHMYLAEQATGADRAEVHFGAMLADMNQMVFDDPGVAGALRYLTHYEFDRIPPSCLGLGFAAHNETWGADWYAHEYFLCDDPEASGLYSTQKILHLANAFAIPPVDAEFLFEFAVDYLLRVDDGPALGRKLRAAALSFGPRQQTMIADAFAAPLREMVPSLTSRDAERYVRTAARRQQNITKLYAAAFMRPDDDVFRVLTQFTTSYLRYDPAVSRERLAYAIELCRDDYRAELDRIGAELRADMAAYAQETGTVCPGGCAGSKGNAPAAVDLSLAALLALGTVRAARRAAATFAPASGSTSP